MEYQLTTVDEIIGSLIRKTRITDTSYIRDAHVWIPEAMGLMKTRIALVTKWQDVCIEFHRGLLPCGTRAVVAVEHNGHRLIRGNDVRAIDTPHHHPSQAPLGTTDGFVTVLYKQQTPPTEDSLWYNSTVVPVCTSSPEQCQQLPCSRHWYRTEAHFLESSIRDGVLRVHYRAMPLDDNGMPLIPDNEYYKVALYYYCRAQMIGAGYPDSVLTWDKIMEPEKGYFEVYAARALGQLRYPSVDSMEAKVNAMTRLIPKEDYYNKFFGTPTPERFYDGVSYYSTIPIL